MGYNSINRQPLFVLLPAFLIMAAMILPLLYLLLRTLGAGKEVWELLFRQRTLQIFGRTLSLIFGVTSACITLSLPLAWLVTRTDLPLKKIWSVLIALPLVIPSYVAGFIILAALGPKGMLQGFLERLFGIGRLPELYGFPGALLTIVMICYPMLFLTIQASLKELDPSLEEASRSMGHSPWQTFLRMVLPQLRPSIASGALLVSLYTLSDFGAVSLLRYETFTWAIYLQYQTSFDRSVAAGLSLVLVAVAISILMVEAWTRGNAQYFRSTSQAKRPPVQQPLGRWRWPAFVFCALVVFFTLIIPMSVLIYWILQGVSRGETFRLVLRPALNSVYVSSLAALTTVVGSLPVAFFTVRNSNLLGKFLERSMYIGYALPGIVVALALVFFTANYAAPLYQTLWVLVFSYVILFMPQALGAIRSSLLKINPHAEEAARSLGRAPLQVLSSVTIPLMRSGILAGGSLVFFTTMKELPATLILSPIGFKTLATSLWSAASEAFFARAGVPALLLILASAVPLVLFTLREHR